MKLWGWLSFNLAYLLGRPRWDTQISPPELLHFIESNPPGRALDLGCGTGTNMLTLLTAGWQVMGVDYAWRAIALARRRLAQAGYKADLRLGNVLDLHDFSKQFDLVLDIGCFHGLSAEGKISYRHEIQHLLAEGGSWLIFGFRNESDEGGFGITAGDIAAIAQELHLISKEDSLDNNHPATWLNFKKS
jgi:cyclopropane fatty-acyl-phospholipid synthase-like methyltransferase